MFETAEPRTEPDATPQRLLDACVTAASSAVGVASAVPVASLDGAGLRGVTLQLERLRTLVDVTEAHCLVELDRRRHTDIRLGASTSKWLAQHAHIPAGIARSRLSLAKRLDSDLSVVDDALVDGRIGSDHARVFAAVVNERNLDALAPVIGDLIDAASAMVFDTWKTNVVALAELTDPDGADDRDDDVLHNKLKLSGSDRFGLLSGELTADNFVTVHDTLHAVADELFAQYTRDANTTNGEIGVPPRSTLLGLALVEICRRALANTTTPTASDPADTDTASGTGPMPGTTAPKVEAHLTIHTLATPTGPDSNGLLLPEHLELLAITHQALGPLPVNAVEHLLCDATWRTTILDSLGVPLDHGRDARFATREQRAALEARDGGCVFPGCDAPMAWLDAHHIRYWERDNGPSDLTNYGLACGRHHRVAHRNGWTLELCDDGWTRWTTPSGYSFWGQRHHHQRAGP